MGEKKQQLNQVYLFTFFFEFTKKKNKLYNNIRKTKETSTLFSYFIVIVVIVVVNFLYVLFYAKNSHTRTHLHIIHSTQEL